MVIKALAVSLVFLLLHGGGAAHPLTMAPAPAGSWSYLEEELLLWVEPTAQFSFYDSPHVQASFDDHVWAALDNWASVGQGCWQPLYLRWQLPFTTPGTTSIPLQPTSSGHAAMIRHYDQQQALFVFGDGGFAWGSGDPIAPGQWHPLPDQEEVTLYGEPIWPECALAGVESAATERTAPGIDFLQPRERLAPGVVTWLEILLDSHWAGGILTVSWPVSLQPDGVWTVDGEPASVVATGRQSATLEIPSGGGLLKVPLRVLVHPDHGYGRFSASIGQFQVEYEPQWSPSLVSGQALLFAAGQGRSLGPGLYPTSSRQQWIWLDSLTAHTLSEGTGLSAAAFSGGWGSSGGEAQITWSTGMVRWDGEALRMGLHGSGLVKAMAADPRGIDWQLRQQRSPQHLDWGPWQWRRGGDIWAGSMAREQWQGGLQLSGSGQGTLDSLWWRRGTLGITYGPSSQLVEVSLGPMTAAWSPHLQRFQVNLDSFTLRMRREHASWQSRLDVPIVAGTLGLAAGSHEDPWVQLDYTAGAAQWAAHWQPMGLEVSLRRAYAKSYGQLSVGSTMVWNEHGLSGLTRWRWQYDGEHVTVRWGPDIHLGPGFLHADAAVGCLWHPGPHWAMYGEFHSRTGWSWQLGWALSRW